MLINGKNKKLFLSFAMLGRPQSMNLKEFTDHVARIVHIVSVRTLLIIILIIILITITIY